ncbi:MAG: hypothetical protein ABLT11_02525 [Candidatus Acidiferrum sp.]
MTVANAGSVYWLAQPCVRFALFVLISSSGFLPRFRNLHQSTATARPPDVILEIIQTNSTFDSDDTYLYLRVFSDSTAEYERRHSKDDVNGRSLKKTITPDQFSRIKSAVDARKVRTLKSRYETRFAMVDTSTTWKINICGREECRTVEIMNFSPGLAKTMKQGYPEALVRLGCVARKVRSDLSGEPISGDSECLRVLQGH